MALRKRFNAASRETIGREDIIGVGKTFFVAYEAYFAGLVADTGV